MQPLFHSHNISARIVGAESQNATNNCINMGSGSRLLSHCFAVPQQCITNLDKNQLYVLIIFLIFYCCGSTIRSNVLPVVHPLELNPFLATRHDQMSLVQFPITGIVVIVIRNCSRSSSPRHALHDYCGCRIFE